MQLPLTQAAAGKPCIASTDANASMPGPSCVHTEHNSLGELQLLLQALSLGSGRTTVHSSICSGRLGVCQGELQGGTLLLRLLVACAECCNLPQQLLKLNLQDSKPQAVAYTYAALKPTPQAV